MPSTPQSNESRAMEGRAFDQNGNDAGDSWYHTVALNTTAEQEQANLEAMVLNEESLAIRQAKSFSTYDPKMGAAAFRSLCQLYPEHPQRSTWENRAHELETK